MAEDRQHLDLWIGPILFMVFGMNGIILNSLQLHILVRKVQSKSNFERVLQSLAAADLISAVGFFMIGLTAFLVRIDLSIAVPLLYIFATALTFAITSSMLHILLITVERFIAVYFPIRHFTSITKGKIKCALIVLWSLSFLIPVISAGLQHHFSNPVIKILAACVLVYVGIICASYISIVTKIYKSVKNGRQEQSQPIGHSREHIKQQSAIALNALAVTLSAVVCNYPWAFCLFSGRKEWRITILSVLGLSSVLNPLIYFLVSHFIKRTRNNSTVTYNS